MVVQSPLLHLCDRSLCFYFRLKIQRKKLGTALYEACIPYVLKLKNVNNDLVRQAEACLVPYQLSVIKLKASNHLRKKNPS